MAAGALPLAGSASASAGRLAVTPRLAAASITLNLEPNSITFGDESKVTFKAVGNAGSVITICRNVTLANGKAGCAIARRKLHPRIYSLTAKYEAPEAE
jgi:hypothetical protein